MGSLLLLAISGTILDQCLGLALNLVLILDLVLGLNLVLAVALDMVMALVPDQALVLALSWYLQVALQVGSYLLG